MICKTYYVFWYQNHRILWFINYIPYEMILYETLRHMDVFKLRSGSQIYQLDIQFMTEYSFQSVSSSIRINLIVYVPLFFFSFFSWHSPQIMNCTTIIDYLRHTQYTDAIDDNHLFQSNLITFWRILWKLRIFNVMLIFGFSCIVNSFALNW